MYLSHFKLKRKPFDISPDPDFLWLGEKHQEGLATLKYGILQNKGFLMITGDIGTGKTALIRAIEKAIEARIIVISIPDPSLSLMDFYNVMASELNIDRTFKSKGEFLIQFKRLILEAGASHRRLLLIIDESHRLSSLLLEEIRLLSNIDLDGKVMINTFFVGQSEFKALIARPENRAVRQRITVNYELLPLTLEETRQYITHRLKVSGASRPIFTPESIRLVQDLSRGYPRLINIICDHALMSGFSSGVDKVGPEIIKECGQELRITIGNLTAEKDPAPVAPTNARPAVKRAPAPPPPAPSSGSDAWRRTGILAASLAVFSLAWYFGGDRIVNVLSRWSAGGERAATETSKAPALSGLTQPAPTEDRGDPAAQGTPAPKPSPERSLPAKRETPGEKPGAQGGSMPAPATTAAPPQTDARPAGKTETPAAVPAAPPPSLPAAHRGRCRVTTCGG